jgi:hypothetical protein
MLTTALSLHMHQTQNQIEDGADKLNRDERSHGTIIFCDEHLITFGGGFDQIREMGFSFMKVSLVYRHILVTFS